MFVNCSLVRVFIMKTPVKCLVPLTILLLASPAPSQETPRVGDPVFAQWTKNAWYHGRVGKHNDEGFHINFDDGDKGVVKARGIALDRVPERKNVGLGLRVLAKWKNDGRYYPGKIDEILTDGRFRIKFEDGDVGHAPLKDIRIILK